MNALDRMAQALRVKAFAGVSGEELIDPHPPWEDMAEDERESYREDVRLVLRMAADELDASDIGFLFGAASCARYLRDIAGDEDMEAPIHKSLPENRAAKSLKVNK